MLHWGVCRCIKNQGIITDGLKEVTSIFFFFVPQLRYLSCIQIVCYFVSVFHFLVCQKKKKKKSPSLVEEPLFRLYRIRCVIQTGDWIKFVWFISFSSNQRFLFSWLYDSLFNFKFYTACWLGTNFWICWFKYICQND